MSWGCCRNMSLGSSKKGVGTASEQELDQLLKHELGQLPEHELKLPQENCQSMSRDSCQIIRTVELGQLIRLEREQLLHMN
jgi:hypothetical protein